MALCFYICIFTDPGHQQRKGMKQIAAIILENDEGEFLFALRDDKSWIPFPGHWDLIGGHVEEGETPEEALVREYREELGLELKEYKFFKIFECRTGDAYENIKFIYTGRINVPIERITLLEGQRAQYFRRDEIAGVRFANIIGSVVMDYIRYCDSAKKENHQK